MRVYLVIEHDWEDDNVDSVWTSRKAARARSDAIPHSWIHTFAVDVANGELGGRPEDLILAKTGFITEREDLGRPDAGRLWFKER